MDNLCHTLVGAAIGYAGLRRTTRLANATLMIAANLPDLDVLVLATDTPSVAFRRGWTHGVLAQLVLPLALTAVMVLIGRRPAKAGEPPLSAGWLLLLSYVGIYSHVFLDFLNNYGIRLLTPFEWRWFYGDTLFIMDPWLWLTLGAGVWLSRRAASTRPARVALALAALYIGVMLVSARVARETVLEAWRQERRADPRALMVGPSPVTPFERQIIVDAGDHYETGRLTWLPTRVAFDRDPVPKNDRREAVRAARQMPAFQAFLVWSRFPFFQLGEETGGTRVSVGDMRFMLTNPLRDALGRGRFTATTVVPRVPQADDAEGN
ncbi:MAG TPA: metal-dependent hydrolase [Vicinamibacterales bacterium]